MKPNLGTLDRWLRTLAALALLATAILISAALPIRIGLGVAALALLGTALTRRCPGYACMDRSTASP